MSPLSARRILTVLTLAILLCAAPVLAQAPARTARTADADMPLPLRILDSLQNAVTHFIEKITVSGGGGGGTIAGPRMDPDGAPTGPGNPPPPTGRP